MKTINYTDYSPFSMVQLQDELSRNSEAFIREREKTAKLKFWLIWIT